MYKYFLLIALILCSFSVSAQWQQTGSKVRYVNGLGIPTKDTAAGVLADSSQILIRPADSSLYVKYKRTWLKVGGGTVSGTINYIPKFTSSTAIGNSQIFDNGTNVGIGTTIPTEKLDIRGTSGVGLQIFETSTGNNNRFSINQVGNETRFLNTYSSGFGKYTFNVGGSERMRIDTLGNVGINQSAPAGRFVVADGQTLLGTNTNNGVDRLQVNGGLNVSAKATAQNLSVVGTTSTTGNIGIFNSAPFYALSVGDGTSTRQVVINGLNSGTSGGSSIAVQANNLTTIMFGNKSNIIGGAYDGQPLFGYGGSTNSLQFYNFNTPAVTAMITSGDRFLIGTTTDNNTDKLQVNGSISATGMKQNYVTKTGAYTASDADYVIDCTSGTFTVTLPASSGRTGRILIIKNSGAGTITVDGNASETIDGAATYSLSVQYATVQIMCDGTNWKIISKF